ncbi:MAG: signal recognition particle-docking protein FtsY, partial [Jatrophihabitantaceae bacterium]
MLAYLLIALAIVVVAVALLAGLVLPRARRGRAVPPPSATISQPTAPPRTAPVDTPPLDTQQVEAPAADQPTLEATPLLDVPEPTAGRMLRLRARLARSQNVFGRGLLAVLARDKLDEDAWDEI